jgi:hypothetical protein
MSTPEPKSITVRFLINRDQLKILRDIAAREDVGFSTIMRRCVRTYLQSVQGGVQSPPVEPLAERFAAVHAPPQPSARAA